MAHLVQTQPRNAISHVVGFTIQSTGVPQQLPPVIVPKGLGVTLRAYKANAAVIQASDQLHLLKGGYGVQVGPGTSVGFALDRMDQLWVMGTQGDSGVATIAGVPIG